MSTDLSGVINDAFQTALSGLITSGKVNELIEASLNKTISDIISRSFNYGDLSKQLEAKVIAARPAPQARRAASGGCGHGRRERQHAGVRPESR